MPPQAPQCDGCYYCARYGCVEGKPIRNCTCTIRNSPPAAVSAQVDAQSSEQGAPELLPCPFCGNKAEHRNTWVWCTNVSCRAHTAGFKPAEWNTRSDICAALVAEWDRLRGDIANRVARYEDERDKCESGGEAWLRIEAMRVTASNILFQFDAAATAIAQAREEK